MKVLWWNALNILDLEVRSLCSLPTRHHFPLDKVRWTNAFILYIWVEKGIFPENFPENHSILSLAHLFVFSSKAGRVRRMLGGGVILMSAKIFLKIQGLFFFFPAKTRDWSYFQGMWIEVKVASFLPRFKVFLKAYLHGNVSLSSEDFIPFLSLPHEKLSHQPSFQRASGQ